MAQRIAELANKIHANLIIDIHADEAILDPKNIEKLIQFHKKILILILSFL